MDPSQPLVSQTKQNLHKLARVASSAAKGPSSVANLPQLSTLPLHQKSLAVTLGPKIFKFLEFKEEFDAASDLEGSKVLSSESSSGTDLEQGSLRRAVREGLSREGARTDEAGEKKVGKEEGGKKKEESLAVVGEFGSTGFDEHGRISNVEERFAVLRKLDQYVGSSKERQEEIRMGRASIVSASSASRVELPWMERAGSSS